MPDDSALLPFFLRQYAEGAAPPPLHPDLPPVATLEAGWLTAAADEIDHLRAYVQQLLSTLREAPTWKDRPFAIQVELDRALAEMDRLRQQLTKE